MNTYVYASVSMVLNDLTDLELAAFGLCVMLDQNPHGRIFDYDKVATLYQDYMLHNETKDCISVYINRRFESMNTTLPPPTPMPLPDPTPDPPKPDPKPS